MMKYKTSEQNEHLREEYLQWARILSEGNPVHGMVLISIQKLCTAFHEIEPAWRDGAVREESLSHFRERLVERTKTVLAVMADNNLGTIDVAGDFRDLMESIESAKTMNELTDLSEKAHVLNHAVCDWLEKTR